MTVETVEIISTSPVETIYIASKFGSKLRGGEIIELRSDLGGGKTAFVKGLAAGMGSSDVVHSPSFTLRNEYRAGKLTLYHFDFYRLHEAGIMRMELSESFEDPIGVTAIEWSDIVEDVLPEYRLVVSLTATHDTSRHLKFSYPDVYAYLFSDKL